MKYVLIYEDILFIISQNLSFGKMLLFAFVLRCCEISFGNLSLLHRFLPYRMHEKK